MIVKIIEGVCGISQILLIIYNWTKGNLEGESGNLSEVT